MSNCKIMRKKCPIWDQKSLIWVFLTKNAVFGYFWARMFLKIYCYISNQHLWLCLIAKYCEIMKRPKFETKKSLFRYFWARILKNIWNQHLQISVIVRLCEKKKKKMNKFGTKNVWFGYFWAGIWKQYCHIWNQYPRICLIAKFHGKTKAPKFWTKNALFAYFWPRMVYFSIFGLEF